MLRLIKIKEVLHFKYHFEIFICLQDDELLDQTIGIREYINCSLAQPAYQVLVEQLCHKHHLAVAQQSGAKDQLYFSANYITSNSNCEAQRVSKMFENICRS